LRVGAGLAGEPIDARIALAAFLSLMISLGLWFAYFRGVARALEDALAAAHDRTCALLFQDVFTYFRVPIIAGIMLPALGVEQAMTHLAEDHPGPLSRWALGCGVALFLVGMIAAVFRSGGNWMPLRAGVSVVLVVLSPVLAAAVPSASSRRSCSR
jgi:low temperature requirement protein LtrA